MCGSVRHRDAETTVHATRRTASSEMHRATSAKLATLGQGRMGHRGILGCRGDGGGRLHRFPTPEGSRVSLCAP